MRDTIREAMDAAKSVQKLSPEAQQFLLMGLVGRMAVKDPDGLLYDIKAAQELDAEMSR